MIEMFLIIWLLFGGWCCLLIINLFEEYYNEFMKKIIECGSRVLFI